LPLVYGPGSKGGLFTYFRLIRRGICPCLAFGEATLGFVEDMVAGIVRAAEEPGARGRTFLLGDDRATSLEDVLSGIEKAIGRKAVRIRIPKRAARTCIALVDTAARIRGGRPSSLRQEFEGFLQYPSWRADTGLAREQLGFRARVAFEDGARITADWYRRQGLL
jgi:nucleoside-diphosphate-sugar epimerase